MIVAAGADPLEERLRLCSHEASRKVLKPLAICLNGVKRWVQIKGAAWPFASPLECLWQRLLMSPPRQVGSK